MIPKMEFWLLSIVALLSVATTSSNAALPAAEMYWHSKLPKTPIPQDLLNLLQPDMGDNITIWDMGYAHETSPKTTDQELEDRRKRYNYFRYRYGYKNAPEEDPKNAFDDEGLEDRRRRYNYFRYRYGYENAHEDEPKNVVEEGYEDAKKRYNYFRYRYGYENAHDEKDSKNDVDEGSEDAKKRYNYFRYRYGYENVDEEDSKKVIEDPKDRRKRYNYFRYRYGYENAHEDSKNAVEENPEEAKKRYNYFRYRYGYENAPGEDSKSVVKEDLEDRRKRYNYFRYRYGYENTPEKDHKNAHELNLENVLEDPEDRRLPNSTIYFRFDDLHAGKKMTTHVSKSGNMARILPRQVAESIPFSIKEFPEILNRFSLEVESPQAQIMKQTMKDCESSGVIGEDKFCARSLESIVDFSVDHIGDDVQVHLNQVDKPKKPQEYTIMDVEFIGDKNVVCHKLNYPYAVYYCHELSRTNVYNTALVGADGTKAKAVIICHSDTSYWNPEHYAFKEANLKPGQGSICHFIRSDTFVISSNVKLAGKASA